MSENGGSPLVVVQASRVQRNSSFFEPDSPLLTRGGVNTSGVSEREPRTPSVSSASASLNGMEHDTSSLSLDPQLTPSMQFSRHVPPSPALSIASSTNVPRTPSSTPSGANSAFPLDNDEPATTAASTTAVAVAVNSSAVPLREMRDPDFVTTPSANLRCPLCKFVFVDAVISACGHTFCRNCALQPTAVCPKHGGEPLYNRPTIPNLAVDEQVGALDVRCDNSENGCTAVLALCDLPEHTETCEFSLCACPNGQCSPMLRSELEKHLLTCDKGACPHATRGCGFTGTHAQVLAHLSDCQFEALKALLIENDRHVTSLTQLLHSRDTEIATMRSLMHQLAHRLEKLERVADDRVQQIEGRLDESLRDVKREIEEIHANMGSYDGLSILDPNHFFKCKGTFVGHHGPVWALTAYGNVLFSGSSDTLIKVWDLSTFRCKATMEGHDGIVHALCTANGMLYSGSSDCTIRCWDVDTYALVHTLHGHEHPVCTLALTADGSTLFSGSHRLIKVWRQGEKERRLDYERDLEDREGLNHWVRALFATTENLYAGCFKAILVFELNTLEIIRRVTTPGGSVYSLIVSQDTLFVGTFENSIHLWDTQTYKHQRTLEGHLGAVYAVAFMNVGGIRRLFSGSYDNTVKIWSLDTWQCTQTLIRHSSSVDALAVLPRGRIASGAADNCVKVWF